MLFTQIMTSGAVPKERRSDDMTTVGLDLLYMFFSKPCLAGLSTIALRVVYDPAVLAH